MIYKNIVLFDEKLVYNKFSINKKDNKIIIKSINIKDNIIKVPVYNKFNGIDYVPICFPLEYIIIDNLIFNPYLILTSYNLQINNDIDFFYNINQIINNEYKLGTINFNDLLNNPKLNLIKILNENYIINLNKNDNLILTEFIKNFWFDINIIKLYIIYISIKYPNGITKNSNIPKNIQQFSNNLKKFKYSLTCNKSEYQMTLNEYLINKFC